MENKFKVEQIDHVELFVPDRYEAVAWYNKVLGLEIIKEFEAWATETGPLMISSDDGNTKLALFTGKIRTDLDKTGYFILAFRVNGDGFIEFLNSLEHIPLYNKDNKRLSKADYSDHGKAFSIYFTDPYGNRLEVTTYEYEKVCELLKI